MKESLVKKEMYVNIFRVDQSVYKQHSHWGILLMAHFIVLVVCYELQSDIVF